MIREVAGAYSSRTHDASGAYSARAYSSRTSTRSFKEEKVCMIHADARAYSSRTHDESVAYGAKSVFLSHAYAGSLFPSFLWCVLQLPRSLIRSHDVPYMGLQSTHLSFSNTSNNNIYPSHTERTRPKPCSSGIKVAYTAARLSYHNQIRPHSLIVGNRVSYRYTIIGTSTLSA